MKNGDTTICDCGHIATSNGFTTGYGVDRDGKKICFECCGKNDREQLEQTGKLSGYYTGGKFMNWPGTFSVHVYSYRKSWHNFAGRDGRTDFWFSLNGRNYHGVQIGHLNECATVRRVK